MGTISGNIVSRSGNFVFVNKKKVTDKAWFSYVGKIPDDRGFYLLPTIPDFADISDIRLARGLSQIFLIICDRGTARGLVMS